MMYLPKRIKLVKIVIFKPFYVVFDNIFLDEKSKTINVLYGLYCVCIDKYVYCLCIIIHFKLPP